MGMGHYLDLPQDTTYLIIDQVNEETEGTLHLALTACAFIGKLWCYRFQKCLFHLIDKARLERLKGIAKLMDAP